MGKTNFSKVEDFLDQGLHKITVKKLLKLADVAAGTGQQTPEKEKERRALISAIKRELKWFRKQKKNIYKRLKVSKKELEAPEKLSDEELKEILSKIEKEKEVHYKKHPKSTDEDLVEAERLKHINKRFNVSDKWLPLH